jgi:hypothetical protein
MGWYDLREGESMIVAVIIPGLCLSFEEAEDEAEIGVVFTAPNGQILIKVNQGDYRPYHF